jgi:hypothetical protein
METHYDEGIRRFGSLRETSVFGFESLLGTLRKRVRLHNNGKNACEQIREDFLLLWAARLKLNRSCHLPQ